MSSHGWSEWVPHPTTANCEYRYRYDERGTPIYDYRQNTPRSGIDDAMRGLNLSDPQEQGYSAGSTNYNYQDQTTSHAQPRRPYQTPGSTPYGGSGQYASPQYAASQPQYAGSDQYAGGGAPYSEPQYGGTPQYDANAAGYRGTPQFGGEPQPQYSSTPQYGGSIHDPKSPRHAYAAPAEAKSSRKKGHISRDPGEGQDSQRHSHRRRDKGKGSSSQGPTDPFYPSYYSSEQTPGTSYYSAPAQDAYATGAGAEDTELDNPSDFGAAAAASIGASPIPSSVTPVAQAEDPPESTVSYDDGEYPAGDTTEGPGDEDLQYEEDLERAKRASKRIYDDPFASQGGSSAGPSSYETDPAYASESAYGEGSTYSLNPDAYDAPDDYDDEYGGAVTPRAPSPSEKITGTVGDRERLDHRFQLHRSSDFDLGRVFKVLWADPKGGNVPEDATDTMKFRNSYGESFYIGIRRFIIIASDEGNSTCVPILTYRGHGCRKNGVKARMHGIIYGSNDKSSKRSKPLDNEPKMGFHPVCMKVTAPGEKLARESRVNYAKLVTIEHNVKVFFIGRLEGDDFEIAKDAVDRCWRDKIREPRKRRH